MNFEDLFAKTVRAQSEYLRSKLLSSWNKFQELSTSLAVEVEHLRRNKELPRPRTFKSAAAFVDAQEQLRKKEREERITANNELRDKIRERDQRRCRLEFRARVGEGGRADGNR